MRQPHPDFTDEYYHDADLRIVQAVPTEAVDILDIDCGAGHRGEVLKHVRADRRVTGIAAEADPAGQAACRLDHVLSGRLAEALAELAPHSFDCIVADDALSRNDDPLPLLDQMRALLRPGGRVVASLPNPQHWSVLNSLLRGDLQKQPSGLLDGHRRPLLAVSNIIKLFLDAGYLPRITDRRNVPATDAWLQGMQPAAALLGLDLPNFIARSQTFQYFIDARPIADLPHPDCEAITLGACTNDPQVLADNLLASPGLAVGRHETLTVAGADSAAAGLNAIIERAQHELVVLAHQDVYLPRWWFARLWQQYALARQATGDRVGVMGVYGVLGTPQGLLRSGRVADRDFLLDEALALPAPASSLDELVLIVPRQSALRFDPALGFHLYGTDIALPARAPGLQAVVIDAPCYHNSRQGDELPGAFAHSATVLREKWRALLPIATPCELIR